MFPTVHPETDKSEPLDKAGIWQYQKIIEIGQWLHWKQKYTVIHFYP